MKELKDSKVLFWYLFSLCFKAGELNELKELYRYALFPFVFFVFQDWRIKRTKRTRWFICSLSWGLKSWNDWISNVFDYVHSFYSPALKIKQRIKGFKYLIVLILWIECGVLGSNEIIPQGLSIMYNIWIYIYICTWTCYKLHVHII